jgi:iron complex transport system substrate-binding protein
MLAIGNGIDDGSYPGQLSEVPMRSAKKTWISWIFCCCLSFLIAPQAIQAQSRTVTDSAGRQVELPPAIDRVVAAGPPASILLYTLAPEKMVGWASEPHPDEKEFLSSPIRDLPVYGRLTGRGGTANIENILRFKPDVIIDVGSTSQTYVSLANNTQAQIGVPYLLFDGRLSSTAATYRALGKALGVEARAEELARYSEQLLDGVASRLAGLPPSERSRVYYGRGPDGLQTGLEGSINLEALDYVGAYNVASAAGKGGLTQVSIEQVLSWDPDVILTFDAGFYRSVKTDPLWAQTKAVRNGRVYKAPSLPFGWFDSPPGVNRLIGIRWLAGLLHPARFPDSIEPAVRDFYARFYHVDLSEAQLAALLEATRP